jgi:nucleoid-associated protein YgaU
VRDLSTKETSGAAAARDPNQSPKTEKIELTVPPPPPAATTAPTVGLLPPPLPPSATAGALARVDAGSGVSTQTIVPVSGTENPRAVGAMPTASTPPIAVPSPSSAPAPRAPVPTTPRVESYDEELYRVKPGDTLEKISRDHFNTDKYAEALKRWNMNHPQASDKMRADPPQLETGQVLYIPPAYMLEKRHGKLIPGWKPPAEPEPSRTANASPDATQNFKWYAVPEGGRMIRDIARATLNDPERSRDIVKLNPNIRPEYLIPGGQLIKLPADARVEATR